MSITDDTLQTQKKQYVSQPAQNGSGNNSSKKTSSKRPTITVGRQRRELIDDMLAVLVQDEAKKCTPTIFIRNGELVRIVRNEKGEPSISEFTTTTMSTKLSTLADFRRPVALNATRQTTRLDAPPPEQEISGLLNLDADQWPFPSLINIVETPVLRPDGSILNAPGYDGITKLYYWPQANMQRCKVPAAPTPQDVQQAVSLIWEAIEEFPYTSDADKANAIALLLTPLLRPAISGHIPLALLDAPKSGTGKGLLADVCAIIATGRYLAKQSPPTTEAEWDKRITALLMQGCPIICFDNITHTLQSNALDAALTTNPYSGRLLGMSKMVAIPNTATWIATGNNLKVGGDLARRCYRIRLNPKTAFPEQRTFTHHPLLDWIQEKRPELVAALLTLARAWYVNGQPPAPTPLRSDTFSPWTQTVGGILAHAGIPGFLENAEQLRAEADEASLQCERFFQAWRDEIGPQWETTGEIVYRLKSDLVPNTFVETLPDELHNAFKTKEQTFSRTLSRWLKKRIDTRYGESDVYVATKFDDHKKQHLFRVFAGDEQDSQVAVQQPVQPKEAHHDVQNK